MHYMGNVLNSSPICLIYSTRLVSAEVFEYLQNL